MWKWQPIRLSCGQMKWTIIPTAAWRKHAEMFGYNFCPWPQAVPPLGKCSARECDWWLQGFVYLIAADRRSNFPTYRSERRRAPQSAHNSCSTDQNGNQGNNKQHDSECKRY